MIAKIVTLGGEAQSRSGFAELAAYIGHDAKAVAIETSASIHSIRTAAQEMEMVAATSSSKIANPCYHYVLSWPVRDSVSNEAMFSAARGSLRSIGFDDTYMWVAAIHGDSAHHHVHVLVNRIHPHTRSAHFPYLDRKALRAFCRDFEQANELSRLATPTARPSLHQRALDSESWTGMMSFQRWVGTEPGQAMRRALATSGPTWQTVHRTLADFNLDYVLYRAGAAVVDRGNSRRRAKATHLGAEFSLPSLVIDIGPYEQPAGEMRAIPGWSYEQQKDLGRLSMPMLMLDQTGRFHGRFVQELREWETDRRFHPERLLKEAGARVRQWRDACKIDERLAKALVKGSRFGVASARVVIPKRWMWRLLRRILELLRGQLQMAARHERAAVLSIHQKPPRLFRQWLKRLADSGDSAAAKVLTRLRSGPTAPSATDNLEVETGMRRIGEADEGISDEVAMNRPARVPEAALSTTLGTVKERFNPHPPSLGHGR